MKKEYVDTLLLQQRLLSEGEKKRGPFEPLTEYALPGDEEERKFGERLLAEGKAGCLLVAGGQGSRLGFEGPKGTFPIDEGTTLFRIFAEKTVKAGEKAGRPLPLAIMTSPENDRETRAFFEKNRYFGLEQEQLDFFSQGELPILDDEGQPIPIDGGELATGPDGNGASLFHFVNSGLWEKWRAAGVEYLSFVMVDNPLADPFDPELLGFHKKRGCDAVVKAVRREGPDEKVGVLVEREGRIEVVEYSELPDEGKEYPIANISLFSLTLPLVKKAAEGEMPYHLAYKSIPGTEKRGWKFEKFIFDFLPFAEKVEVLLYPRKRCYAPLKNRTGPNSPETVRRALGYN